MKLALWFLALAALVMGTWLVWGGGWDRHFTLEGSIRWLEGTGSWAWAAGIGLLASDIVLPVPGTVISSALGYIYGTFVGGVVATVGLVAAGLLGYGAGRCFGGRFARKILGDRDFEKGERLFAKGGGWIVALSRSLPILPEVISCTAGLVRMPFRNFVIALFCGAAPMGFAFAAVGSAGREAPVWALALNLAIPAVLWGIAAKLKHR